MKRIVVYATFETWKEYYEGIDEWWLVEKHKPVENRSVYSTKKWAAMCINEALAAQLILEGKADI